MGLIDIQSVTKKFPLGNSTDFIALTNINLKVEKGEFAGLIGPSGSGKTTLLNIIGSLDAPTEGDAFVLGEKVNALSEKQAAVFRSKHMGFVFQTYNLLPVYTAYENIELPLLLLKIGEKERKQRVMEALDWVGLADKAKSRPSQLSSGQAQRVAIARAIVKKPALLIADEPTANLDSKNSFNVLDTMARLNMELRTTFIFATHDEKVIKYLRRKIVLNDGKIEKDEVVKNPNNLSN